MGVKGRIWYILKEKNEKIAHKTQYRLARIFILGLYDSPKNSHMHNLSELKEKGKYCSVF